MTRTDLAIAAVTRELEGQRQALDADDTLASIEVHVLLREGGVPEKTWTEKKTKGQSVRRFFEA